MRRPMLLLVNISLEIKFEIPNSISPEEIVSHPKVNASYDLFE